MWKIVFDCIFFWWYYFVFIWNGNYGFKFYENGKFVVFDYSFMSVVKGFVSFKGILIIIGRLNFFNVMVKFNSYGNFRIGYLVIWLYELLVFDVEVVFLII